MTININGYSEEDLQEDYDKGILDGYGMAMADFSTAVENLCNQIEDPPGLRKIALQVISKTKNFVAAQLEDRRDHLLVALVENPNRVDKCAKTQERSNETPMSKLEEERLRS